jgi:putative two-component system response regulator
VETLLSESLKTAATEIRGNPNTLPSPSAFTLLADTDSLPARLLIIDDEEVNVRVLRRVLERAGYLHLGSTSDARQAATLFAEFEPDLVLLDLRMPFKDGFTVLEELSTLMPPQTPVPVVVLTADVLPEVRQQALSAGASDFLTKPLDTVEVLLRVRNLLRARFANVRLEVKVHERTRALEEAQLEVLQRLAQAAEFRDDDTGQHTHRVAEIAALLASHLGFSTSQTRLIQHAAPLHDVGKIGIPDEILLKPGRLTPEEFAVMKSHTIIGAKLLTNGRSELMQLAERIALSHHERWSGDGYPHGLKEEAIPLEGRILAVVDVFDALTHARPYKAAWPVEDAVAEIARNAGSQFDPRVVEEFLQLPHAELV